MDRELLTTREVAKMLGVGTTSIKRWADSGLLRCVKTPGGHRRFPREQVETFLATDRGIAKSGITGTYSSRVEMWMAQLRDGIGTNDIVKLLYHEFHNQGMWFEVADSMSMVLDEIGRAWARGDLSIVQEHIISERLQRAVARIVEAHTLPEGAHTCMLMAVEGEDHTLGLGLAELCLREAGWGTTWVGRQTPVNIACEFIANRAVDMVAVSASEYQRDTAILADQAERLAYACQGKSIPLLLGGTGLWPENLTYGQRVITFSQLHDLLV